jgi:hypothetical protein
MLAVAAILVLTGCSKQGADAAEVVREAPDKTIDAGSARASLTVSFTAGGTPGTIRGEGVFDLRNRLGALAVDLGELGARFGTATVGAVIGREGLFVKVPPGGAFSGSRPWYKIDLASVGQQAGLSMGSLAQLQQSDPTQVLGYLKGAVDDVNEVGEESVRGADTTHYRGTVDLRKASASLPPESQRSVEDAIASLGTSTLPADVWVDDEGRIRRLSFSADPDGTGPNPGGTVEIELFDFGVTADAAIPPADQVTDLTNLFQGTAPTAPR